MKNVFHAARFGAAASLTLFALTACSATQPSNAAPAAEEVTISDAWVKAAGPGEMTAVFGFFENSGEHDATVSSVRSVVSEQIELHETVPNESGQMVMREVEGGFVLPAEQGFALEPGGNHIMLMDLPQAVRAGEEASFTVAFADGSELDFTALVKDYSGAKESYEAGHGESAHDAHGSK